MDVSHRHRRLSSLLCLITFEQKQPWGQHSRYSYRGSKIHISESTIVATPPTKRPTIESPFQSTAQKNNQDQPSDRYQTKSLNRPTNQINRAINQSIDQLTKQPKIRSLFELQPTNQSTNSTIDRGPIEPSVQQIETHGGPRCIATIAAIYNSLQTPTRMRVYSSVCLCNDVMIRYDHKMVHLRSVASC